MGVNAPLDEIEFPARSDHRVEVIDALARQPSDRNDRRAATGASSPTVGRILDAFGDRRWIVRDGRTYELTRSGEFVAERFTDLREAMEMERRLRDVWRWLPRETVGFTVDLFADAVVSYPGPGYPYEPVERLTRLIGDTGRLRGFDSIMFKSINNETVCRAVLDGMELEYVYSPIGLEATVTWDPERVVEAAARENCTVLVHDDLPTGTGAGSESSMTASASAVTTLIPVR
ncbi:helix-turn-helix transcriptional regulator [Halorarum salinum]|uniref:helix-turn-helix transcriptional regulator n=1 Tax=Halorarum salinum TaxID=2743089 RepID=UPI001FE901C2|nr:transcriptional regulator [Halobaculum salinum]